MQLAPAMAMASITPGMGPELPLPLPWPLALVPLLLPLPAGTAAGLAGPGRYSHEPPESDVSHMKRMSGLSCRHARDARGRQAWRHGAKHAWTP